MNFWDVHGCWFIFFMFIFPRLTMFFMGICTMGFSYPILFWVGWGLTPRLVVAILATSFYWESNPILCIFAWIYCFTIGNGSNKVVKEAYDKKTT